MFRKSGPHAIPPCTLPAKHPPLRWLKDRIRASLQLTPGAMLLVGERSPRNEHLSRGRRVSTNVAAAGALAYSPPLFPHYFIRSVRSRLFPNTRLVATELKDPEGSEPFAFVPLFKI